MAKIPALPSTVDIHVRRAFEAVRKALESAGNSASAVAQSSGSTSGESGGTTTYPVPVAPTGLVATPGFASVLLQCDQYQATEGFAHYNFYRASVDDPAQKVLIGSPVANIWPDLPPADGLSETYYYWFSVTNQNGVEGPLNAAAGVAATTSTSPSYMLEVLTDGTLPGTPELPFIVHEGALYFNVAYFREASIETLHLKDGCVDNLKVALGLDAAKITFGVMDGITVKTTDPVTGKYSLLEGGDLVFYKDAQAYKYLKQIKTGQANSGDLITLLDLDRAPEVLVSLRDLRAYDPAYSDQKQRWAVKLQNDEVIDNGDGSFSFTPICQLSLDAGNTSEGLGYSYSGSSAYTTGTETTPANTNKITVSGTLNSIRGTGTANSYYYRQCTIELFYRVSPSGTWNSVVQVKAHGGDLTIDNFSISTGTITADTYDYYLVFTWADAGGTFSTGGTTYDYDEANTENLTTFSQASVYHGSISAFDDQETEYMTLPSYTPPAGWSIYQVDYQAEYDPYLYKSGTQSGTASNIGPGSLSLSLSSAGTIDNSWTNKAWSEGSYRTSLSYQARIVKPTTSSMVTLSARLQYRNIQATIKIRKPQTNSTTAQNSTNVTGADYELASASVIDGTGVVNWIAVS